MGDVTRIIKKTTTRSQTLFVAFHPLCLFAPEACFFMSYFLLPSRGDRCTTLPLKDCLSFYLFPAEFPGKRK